MEGDFLFSGRQILKNTLLLTAAALLLRLVSMLLQAYLSARIGADGLGLVQLVLSVCAFSMTLGLAGARVAATCLCAQAHGRRSGAEVQSAVYQCLGYVLVTSCTVSAVLFFAAPWLSGKLLQEPAAEAGLRLLAGMLPSACVNLVLGGYFTATGQVLRLTAVDMGERVLCLGLTFLFLQVSGSDAAGACLALLSGDLLSGCAATALLYCLFRRKERGAIVTDDKMMTNVANVYAVGDVNGKIMLAHTAYREAEVAVNNILGKKDHMRYNVIPSVVYTTPEIGSVGETEESAKAKGLSVKTLKLSLMYSGRYVAENTDLSGICKLIVNTKTNTLIGAHIIGSYASEYIVAVSALIDLEVDIEVIKKLVFPHPTVCEIIRETIWSE